MSKSKGNVIDPVLTVEKYGCDVLRYTLASLTTPGRNLLLGEDKIEGTRNFANKIWNASKFVISAIKNTDDIDFDKEPEYNELDIWDRWILERLNHTIKSYERYIEKYNFSFASKLLYSFFWNEFCDWYIEAAKVNIYSNDANKKNNTTLVLYHVLEIFLRLMHPIMPFLTEYIWQCLPVNGESIMVQEFPKASKHVISTAESEDINYLFDIISEIRKSRSELSISPASKVTLYFNIKKDGYAQQSDKSKLVRDNENYIKAFCKASAIGYKQPDNLDSMVKSTVDDTEIFVDISQAINYELEIKRIESDIRKFNIELEKSEKKIGNPDFLAKAPEDIINKEKNKASEIRNKLSNLEKELVKVKKSMISPAS